MIDIENLSDLELDELQTKYENIKIAWTKRQPADRPLERDLVGGSETLVSESPAFQTQLDPH